MIVTFLNQDLEDKNAPFQAQNQNSKLVLQFVAGLCYILGQIPQSTLFFSSLVVKWE